MVERVNVLDSILNKFVKVLFKDGDQIRSIRGDLISYSDDFVELKTLSKTFLLNRSSIVKIQESESNGRTER